MMDMELSPKKEALKDLLSALRKLGLPSDIEEGMMEGEGAEKEPEIDVELASDDGDTDADASASPQQVMDEAEEEGESPAKEFEEYMKKGDRNVPVGADKKGIRLGMTSVEVGADPKAKLKKMMGR